MEVLKLVIPFITVVVSALFGFYLTPMVEKRKSNVQTSLLLDNFHEELNDIKEISAEKTEKINKLRISAIAIACFGIIRSLLFLTYSFTLTDRNPLFFSLIHPLIRSDGCCEPIDPVTHPLPSDFRSCCTIH